MTRHALIIGIAEYASFSRLDKATGDAEAVAQILEKHGNFETVKRLPTGWNETQSLYYVAPEKLTGEELGEALKTFFEKQAKGQEALIYFTGHGFKTVDSAGSENGYLATSDCRPEFINNVIREQRYGFLLESLNGLIGKAELSSLIVLLDCCYSGSIIEQSLMKNKLDVFSKTTNYHLIASSREFEKSYVGKEHSVFTGALLEALSPQYADVEGNISIDRLFGEIKSLLKQSGQQPISMGVGTSLVVISYPPAPSEVENVRVNTKNPYVGLEAFNEEKSSYFFGREKAIQDLQLRLHQGRFLSVIGASGAGKSSLIKAGLLPLLNREYAIASLAPGYNPPQVLIDRLTSLLSQNRPFILFIDQFEEVFTLCKDDELRKSFFHLVAEVVKNSERQGQVIIAIRGDFLDRCAEYPEIAALVNETQPTTYMVEPLTTEELYRAIAEPAKLHGVSFQGGLVERMVREVAEQPAALPLLQYALRELWRVGIEEATSETAMLTWEEYNQIGGVGGALDKKADLIYSSFPEERDRDLLRRLCLELVELGEGDTVTRRRVARESLAAEEDPPEQFERVLDSLVKSRLVATTLHKVSGEHYESYVEVTHEALLSNWGMLRDWIEENRDNLRRKRRFEGYFATWCKAGKSEEALLSGLWLSDAEALQGQEGVPLSAEEKEFIEESVKRRDREVQAKLDNERRLREAAEKNAEVDRKLKLEAEKAAKAESERAKEAEARALAELEQKLEAEKATEAEREKNIQAQKALEAEQKRVRIQKQRTKLAIVSLISVTGLTLLAGIGWLNAERARILALSEASDSLFTVNRDSLDPLLKALEAAQRLQNISWLPGNNEARDRVMEVLAQSVYWTQEVNRLEGHTNKVQTVSVNPKTGQIASGGYDNTVKLWNADGREIKPTIEHQNAILSLAFSPDGRKLVSSSEDGVIKILDTQTQQSHPIPHDTNWSRAIAFSANPKLMATGDRLGFLRLRNWDGTLIGDKIKAHSGEIYDLSFSPDGSLLATASEDGVKFWDVQPKPLKPLKPISGKPEAVYSLSFIPDGSLLATASEGNVTLWKRQPDRTYQRLTVIERDKFFTKISFSQDGNAIAAATAEGTIYIFDREGQELEILEGHNGRVNSLAFNSQNEIISASDDSTLKIWQWQRPMLQRLIDHTASVTALDWSPDGKRFVSGDKDGKLKLWSMRNRYFVLSNHKNINKIIFSAKFHPSKEQIAIAAGYNPITLLDFNLNPLPPLPQQKNRVAVRDMEFSKDGQFLVSAKEDGAVELWQALNKNNSTSWNFLPLLIGHQSRIKGVSFSSRGEIASGGNDRSVRLWDSRSQKQLKILDSHEGGINEVTFSPDGKIIASASQDKTVKLWSREGSLIKTIQPYSYDNVEGHKEGVSSVLFDKEGKMLVTGSNDGIIKLWSRNGKLILTLKGHTAGINELSFNPQDNTYLASSSEDKTVLIWNLQDLTFEHFYKQGCALRQDYLKHSYPKNNRDSYCLKM